jgi:hypothetical protein
MGEELADDTINSSHSDCGWRRRTGLQWKRAVKLDEHLWAIPIGHLLE